MFVNNGEMWENIFAVFNKSHTKEADWISNKLHSTTFKERSEEKRKP